MLTFPQHALQMLPLQLMDAEPQQTLMPLEHALASACVLKRSTARKLMQRMTDWRRMFAIFFLMLANTEMVQGKADNVK